MLDETILGEDGLQATRAEQPSERSEETREEE